MHTEALNALSNSIKKLLDDNDDAANPSMHVGKAFMIKVGDDDPHKLQHETLKSPSEALCNSEELLQNRITEEFFISQVYNIIITSQL